jgi:transcriptional regulator with XRE-family HTH domain
MTQEVLAERINVTKVSVSGYETGNRLPDIRLLSKICDVLQCSADYLLGKIDQPDFNKSQLSDDLYLPIEEIMAKYTLTWESEDISSDELEDMLIYIKVKRLMKERKRP